MSYATMAHITDYDVWHESEEPVTVDAVIRVLLHNAEVAKDSVRQCRQAPGKRCSQSLSQRPAGRHHHPQRLWPEHARGQLELLIGKYL